MVEDVRSGLSTLGWRAELAPLPAEPRAFLASLDALPRYDALFNLTEYLGGSAAGEERATALLEQVGRRFTGNSSRALSLCRSKIATRALLLDAGIPVPAGRAIRSVDESLASLPWPCIVKPSNEDSSRGIEHDSVANDEREARTLVIRLFQRGFGPALAEAFVPGREFGVAILEDREGVLRALPLLEVHYTRSDAAAPRLFCYASKWEESHALYHGSTLSAAAPVSEECRAEMEAIALAVWRACGLRGYARIDLRLDEAGRPFVIDVNPNPDIGVDGGFADCAARAAISYPELLGRLVQTAI
jgi:D-alanine-D-alanine ligase